MLRGLILAAVLVCATSVQAQTLHPLPRQPAGVAWPGADWETAPLPADVDRAAYDLAVTEAFAGVHPLMGETRAVVVVQGGRIVFERYNEGFTRDTRLISWSVAKSVTQALVGTAVLQGRVAIDTPMGNPHWRAGDRRGSITWRDWLNMVDGQDYLEIGAPSILANDVTHMLYGAFRGGSAADPRSRHVLELQLGRHDHHRRCADARYCARPAKRHRPAQSHARMDADVVVSTDRHEPGG